MASTRSLVEYVTEQMGADVTWKAMFGEYGIHLRGILIGLFCDDRLFLKPTTAGAYVLSECEMASPYPGAKPAMLVAEESWDDRSLMSRLAEATASELLEKGPASKRAKRAPRMRAKPGRRPTGDSGARKGTQGS